MSGERKRPIEEEPEYDYDALLSLAEEEMADPKPLRKRLKCTSNDDAIEIIEKKTSRLAPVLVERTKKPLPTRHPDGRLAFKDFPEFQPNLTPKEIIQAGSFGGCYFQRLASAVTGQTYVDAWREFPSDWFEGLVITEHVASPTYNKDVNAYKVSCGSSVQQWEDSGWVTEIDPYGWFQWYCRFYLGRRCSDDYRQITRALGVMGPSGRWRKNLINKCLSSGKSPDEACIDFTISPKIRQLLQQWGYRLSVDDLTAAVSPKKKKSDL
eukprot:CAMPEP_0173146276 /NCGR_PEP_ID=MMETSP1105-20130129/8396_1 /TAXON_ID=2985 /ORGANISM="Ochromonas sp., Strain BG-1" /LENGTH=266 /DNA_ID=CAMNT_0014060445 /DNA_START=100 /DNA_END=901 /DNA_ORIENTATION=+